MSTKDIIDYCKATAKKTVNNKLYISILTARNFLTNKGGIKLRTDSIHEKERCNGDENCYLHNFRALKDIIVMTLNVEIGGERTQFEVRPFNNHRLQNCDVVENYLQYLFANCKNRVDKTFNKNVIDRSNELYAECSKLYDDLGYGKQPENNFEINDSEFPEFEVKKILPRPNPVVQGVSFSNVVKIGIEENEDVAFDFDKLIDDVSELQKNNEALISENDKLRIRLDELLKTNEQQDQVIKKLNSELSDIRTKLNKFQVMIKNKK